MKVVCVDPRTDPLWRSLVEKTESSVFHSPSWIRVLTDTYGWEASAYVIVDDAESRGPEFLSAASQICLANGLWPCLSPITATH